MKKNEIYGYEPLVDDLKELIHKKQYQVIKLINSETINLYWEIGEEIYRQLITIGVPVYVSLMALIITKPVSGPYMPNR